MVRKISAISCGLLTLALAATACGGNPAKPSKTGPDLPPPAIAGVAVTPPLGVAGVTTFTLAVDAVAQPGTSLTVDWDLGDGSRASGATVTKVYNNGRNYPVIVSVTARRSDGGYEGSATSRFTVPVAVLTGTWSEKHLFDSVALHLRQDGAAITGVYVSDSIFPVQPGHRQWTITANAPGHVDAVGAFQVPTGRTSLLYATLRSIMSASYGYTSEATLGTLTKTSETP
jgi:hypothetical protein